MSLTASTEPTTNTSAASSAPESSTISLTTASSPQVAPSSQPSTGTGATAAGTPSWRDSLPEELRAEAAFAKFTDVAGLAKSYLNAEKMIGADKIPLPGKHATEADWQNVFKKLGAPESPDKYEFTADKGIAMDDGLLKGFKETACKAGILPKQAQGMLDWWNKTQAERGEQLQTQMKQFQEQGVKALKEEWGSAFDRNMRLAQSAVEHYGGKEFVEWLNKTGLSSDPTMIRLMNKVGGTLKEDQIPMGGLNGWSKSPSEAKAEMDRVMGDPSHPYFHKDHPGHATAVKEMSDLFQFMNG